MAKPSKSKRTKKDPSAEFRKKALSMPGATEGTSCNNAAFKAGSKNFFFLGERDDGRIKTMLKLTEPASLKTAAKEEKARPDNISVGKGGWVSGKFDSGADVPVELMLDWIVESYRALAPKKLVAELDR